MELGAALLAVGAGDRAASFELFSETLEPAWIDEALHATDRATVRRWKLPAQFVGWLVVGMALYLVNRFIPMASSIKSILNVVVVVAVCVWVLQATGLWGPISSYRLTR